MAKLRWSSRLAGVNSFGISGTKRPCRVAGTSRPRPTGGLRNGTSGSVQAIGVSLPTPLSNLDLADKPSNARQKRFLPISGKSDGAVSELAQSYISWLDEHSDELVHDHHTAQELLSDIGVDSWCWEESLRSPCWYRVRRHQSGCVRS